MASVSLFGSTGFIGTAYANHSENQVDGVDRNNPDPLFTEIVYALGTTDNYNVFHNPRLDVESLSLIHI